MSSRRSAGKLELMGGRRIISTSCKKGKYALYSSLAGWSHIISEPLSSYGVYPIGRTRHLIDSLAHLFSSSHSTKSIFFVPWDTATKDCVNNTCYLSCKSSSSCFFTLPPVPESVVEISECWIILPCRDSCKDKSHFEPFVPLPCHSKIDGILSRLKDCRIETDISNKILLSGKFLDRISTLSNYCSDSNFSHTWDGKEDMVGVESIHYLINLSFKLLNLPIELEDSLCSPFDLIFEDGEHIMLEDSEEGSVGAGRGDALEIRMKGEELEEGGIDFISDHSFISRENQSEIFPEAIYTSCSLLYEDSSKSCIRAQRELMGRERVRGLRGESFEVSSDCLSIDFIGFTEGKVGFSETLNTVGVNHSYFESPARSTEEERLEGDMVISCRFHTNYDTGISTHKTGEGEAVLSEESESLEGIRVFSGGEISFIAIHEASGKLSLTEIDTDIKVFKHMTSFHWQGVLLPPCSDGNYPPGLSARSTSCNQISPSECGEPSSFSCSRHIQNEGLPDTLRFSNSIVNKSKLNCYAYN